MKKKSKVLWLITTCLIVILAFGFTMAKTSLIASAGKEPKTNDAKKASKTDEAKEKSKNNLIVLIGDGMGPSQVTLSRLYAQKYDDVDRLYMDDYLVGMNSTHAEQSLDGKVSGVITDSAASGTAFATGNKTYNGAISVTNEKVAKPVASVLEAAKEEGKATGLVSTARLTHATPAVYASHVRSRENEDAIASQFLDAEVDVLIGGGEYHFVGEEEEAEFGRAKREDGKNLVKEFKEKGYAIANDKKELKKAEGDKLLALLSDSHVPFELDRKESVPRLKEQLESALKILEKNNEGFVLMVEAGRIDHGGHANDIHSVVRELLEFDEAFEAAVDYAKVSGNTSVIATADHETGGLTIGRDNIADVYFDAFRNVTASSEVIGEELEKAKSEEDRKAIMKKHAGIEDLSPEELAQLKSVDGEESPPSGGDVFNIIIAERSNIGWTGYGHTGVDVGVYGYGPAADLLAGFNDNTDFAKVGATVLGLDLEKTSRALQQKYAYPIYEESEAGELLFPAGEMQELLDVHVNASDGKFDVSGNGISFTVKQDAQDVKIGDTTYDILIQEEQLYIPFELLEALSKQEIAWDELSERIVMGA